MTELNQQNQYDAQDQQANQEKNENKSTCLTCCCDYIKWSFKTACKICECTARCM